MKRIPLQSGLSLAVDVVLLILCALHVPSLLERAEAPFTLREENNRIVISGIVQPNACPELKIGDEILAWEIQPIHSPGVIDFLADNRRIGESVNITFRTFATTSTVPVRLVPAYQLSYVLIVCFVGLATWCLALFVLLARPGDPTARIMHWAMISMAVAVVIAFEGVTSGSKLGYVSSILFFTSYMGVTTTFFLLTTIFPRLRFGPVSRTALVVFSAASALTALMVYHHARAVFLFSLDEFATYEFWFNIFHLVVLLLVGAGISMFVYSYLTTTASEERKKLTWVLWGLCIGPTPFLLLSILPQAFQSGELVPEEYTLVFLVFIPITFAVALIRHHLLDIEVVISRTTAYAIVVACVLASYTLMVLAVASFVGQRTASAAAAVLVALLFEPVRARAQRFVDKRFFRARYDFREAERTFVEHIKRCLTVQQLAELTVQQADTVIPAESIGFVTLQQPSNRLRVLAHKNLALLERRSIQFRLAELKTRLDLPIALDDKIEAGVPHEPADGKTFHRWNIALSLCILSEKSELLGFFVLGQKKSGTRFSSDDIDLLRNIATQAGLALERITLQQKLVLEHAEAERFKELNQLKSDFVSYVSHELRTPLTSITLFAELLENRSRKLDRKSLEHVRTIKGESARLDRMVTNILDSARIDKGLKEYEFTAADLGEITERAITAMKYQLDKHGFRTVLQLPKRPLPIHADPDAIAQAIINLIGNAIKYSASRKYLRVQVSRKNGTARCQITDRGRGISQQAIPHLLERFYRDPAHSTEVQGVGLGLPIVKHIMDAHGGSIDVTSTSGRGSVFSLSFPLKITARPTTK